MRILTDKQTQERYGISLAVWLTLTISQRAGHRSNYHKRLKQECECGNPATVMRSGFKICERCARLESERGQSFDGHGIGETSGTGYDPFYFRFEA